MALKRSSKESQIEALTEKLSRSKSVVFANFKGLNVKDTEELRRLCGDEQVECVVAKKSLIKIALQKGGVDEINPRELEGEIAAVFSYADEVAGARVVNNFSKTHEKLTLESGLVMTAEKGSRALEKASLKQFATLPTKRELHAQLVGSLASPLRGLVGVLSGNMRGFVQVLKAMSEKAA